MKSFALALLTVSFIATLSSAQAGYYSDGEHINCDSSLSILDGSAPADSSYQATVSSVGAFQVFDHYAKGVVALKTLSAPVLSQINVGTSVGPALRALASRLRSVPANAFQLTVRYDFPILWIEVRLPNGEVRTNSGTVDVTRGAYHGNNRNQGSSGVDLSGTAYARSLGIPSGARLSVRCF